MMLRIAMETVLVHGSGGGSTCSEFQSIHACPPTFIRHSVLEPLYLTESESPSPGVSNRLLPLNSRVTYPVVDAQSSVAE